MVLDPERPRPGAPVPWMEPATSGGSRAGEVAVDPSRHGYASMFEEPGGGDDDLELVGHRRRHPPAVRLIGAVLAAALLLATVGTTIGVLLGGSSAGHRLRTTVLSVVPVGPGPASGHQAVAVVTFTVEQPASTGSPSPCRITVSRAGRTLGALSGFLAAQAGGRQRVRVRVPLARPLPAGSSAVAVVACSAGADASGGN